jgi:hypothetical protein
LFQGDNGKRNKQQLIDLFTSLPNYVAFFFRLSSTILRDFLPASLDHDVVYRQQMKITREIGDRTGEAPMGKPVWLLCASALSSIRVHPRSSVPGSTIRIMGIMELGLMILMVFVATSYRSTPKAHGTTMGIMEPQGHGA